MREYTCKARGGCPRPVTCCRLEGWGFAHFCELHDPEAARRRGAVERIRRQLAIRRETIRRRVRIPAAC
jgi:hypothetical protein